MPAPRPPAFDTLSLHAGQHPDPGDGRARRADLRDDVLRVSATPITPRRCSISSAPATSIRASPTRRRRCWKSASPRSKAASAPSAPPAAWRRCIWRSRRCSSAGDHIVASSSLYGGTINLLTQTLPRFGVTTSFVKPRDHAGFAAAIGPQHPAGDRRDHRQSRPRSARHSRRRRRSPMTRASRS